MIKQIAFLLLTILILSAGTLAAPTASLEASPENGPSPLTVNFSGDCSDSNAIVSCTIDLGDGNMVVDLNSLGGSHTYYARGTYYLNLFALNSKGESDDEITVITVSNQAPTAALNVSPGSGNPGLVVTLSGSCQDLDGNATIKTCFLDYGDGNAEAIAGPAPYCFSKTHTFYQIGQLQAKLRASDDMDLNGQDIEVVTISATAAPTITNKKPDNGDYNRVTTQLVSFDVIDSGSGIKINDINVFVDGNMHIPFGSLAIAPIANGNKVSFTIPYAVNNRTVSIHVDVNDNFQNKANENWSFTIDTQAPALGGISVAEYTNDSTPAISIQNAAGSPSEMALSCNGSSWKAWQAYSGTADNFSITSSSYGCLGDSEGTVTVYLKLRDLAGNESTAKNDSTTYDYRKPGTPTLDSASAGNGNVFLDWASVSDNGPSGIKDYLIYRNGTQIDTTTTTEYTATGLSNGTEYRFEIRAKDRAGNLSDYSNEKRATPSSSGSSGSGSTACSNDNSEPWLEWEFPTNNSTVSGVVRLKVRSYDDECGVRFVQFRVDDAPIGSDSTAASERYTFDWNSEKVADGTHVLKALSKSYNADETENSITKTVTVKTSNGVSKAEEEAGADNNRPAAQSAIDSAEAAKENADAVVAELASVGVLPGDGASSLISDASGLLGDAKALFGDGEYAEAVEKAEEAGAKFDEAAGMLAVEDYGEASDYVFNEEHLDILLRGMGFSQQLVDEAKAILENCGVDRSISFKQVSDGEGNYYRAVITVSVKNESGEAMDVKVVEVVPKEFAASASEIAGTGFTVIVDDPVIEWIVSLAAGEEKQVVYALKRELTAEQADAMASSGVINKFAAPPVLLNAGTDVESMFSQAPTGLFGLGGTVEIVGVAIVICAIIFFAVLYIAGRRGNGNESPFGLDAAARRAGFGSGFFDRLGRKEEPSGPKWRYRE